ncbi:concanavalin A-like lectin/glucanase domain-containing protein [Bisporella sp. PMI_857]|nr:concanavalin A-like lectin/glucanase domain-containing protein [Bisporella sp. PMI_857]
MTRLGLLQLGIFLLCAVGKAQKDNGKKCDCFKTNGSTEAYFSYHRFFDYRNVPLELTSQPAIITQASDSNNYVASSAFFSDSSWTSDWDTQTWNNSDFLNDSSTDASVLMIYSKNNVYIEPSTDSSPNYNSYLTMRTTRTESFQSAAEIDSTAQNYQYLSARFLARIIGPPGACAGIFTWYCPGLCRTASSPDVEEADIEILTSGPSDKIQLTNQPSESTSGDDLPEATRNASLPGAVRWSEWSEYRYDWLPGLSSWYVNGESVGSISFQAPKNPAGLILNMWGNGGSWTGNMTVGDAAYLQIQWIEIAYNTSGPATRSKAKRGGMRRETFGAFEGFPRSSAETFEDGDSQGPIESRTESARRCKVVCSIDANASPGTPVVSIAGYGPDLSFTWLLVLVLALASISLLF